MPVTLIATLTVGLREDSRTMMRITKCKIPRNERLLALIVDNTALLLRAFLQSRSKKKLPEYESVFEKLIGVEKQEQNTKLKGFDSEEDFFDYWNKRNSNA